MLAVRDVAYGYGQRVIGRGVSFALAGGQTLALLGGNGCGKTTLLRTVLGLLPPLEGSVTVADAPLPTLTPAQRARRLAYVPQQSNSVFAFSVREAVMMGRAAGVGWFGQPNAHDRAVVDDVLHRVGVQALATRPMTEISGGERQLALVARALAQEADVLVLDEPTANLDFGNRMQVLAELDRLRAAGHTVIFSTHDPDQALAHAERALLLRRDAPPVIVDVATALDGGQLSTLYGVPLAVAAIDGVRRVFPVSR